MRAKFEVKADTDFARLNLSIFALHKEVSDGKPHVVDIKPLTEKRSLDANAYSWVLQGAIAKALNRRIDDIHNEMVMQYGATNTVSIKKAVWASACRIFDYYKVLGESELNGENYVHARVGIGTHHYDTKEMYHFIQGIIAEAQDLGIETATPDELAKMKGLREK